MEHFPGLTGHPSDVQRFSEEDGDGDGFGGGSMVSASRCCELSTCELTNVCDLSLTGEGRCVGKCCVFVEA